MAKDDANITSSGRTVSNEKTREQEQKLKDMKEKAEKDKKAAKEKREKAEKEKSEKDSSSGSSKKTTAAVAAAAGAAVIGSLKGKGKKRAKKKLITLLVAVALIVVALVLFGPKLKELLGIASGGSIIPGSLSEMQADEVMGYNEIDFQNALLGDPVAKQELIVMEQPVEVESQISQALANISLFQKTKVIHSVGTGVYTVDMSRVSSDKIAVDMDARTVTVTIPHAALQYINIDPTKTEFEDTQNAILAFGELKMTLEQEELLDISIQEAMREELETDAQFAMADEYAKAQVYEVFYPLISAISDEFALDIVIGE